MESLKSALGYVTVDKKQIFSVDQKDLQDAKNKLNPVSEIKDEDVYYFLGKSSGRYAKYWITANPKSFNEASLSKLRNAVMDQDIPVRRTFSFLKSVKEISKNEEPEEETNYVNVTKKADALYHEKIVDTGLTIIGCLFITNFTCAAVYMMFN